MIRRNPGSPNPGPVHKSATATASDTSMLLPAADIPGQLRRRRAGSYRLPVLDDGRRDPADPALRLFEFGVETRRQAWAHLTGAGLMCEHVDRLLRAGDVA